MRAADLHDRPRPPRAPPSAVALPRRARGGPKVQRATAPHRAGAAAVRSPRVVAIGCLSRLFGLFVARKGLAHAFPGALEIKRPVVLGQLHWLVHDTLLRVVIT